MIDPSSKKTPRHRRSSRQAYLSRWRKAHPTSPEKRRDNHLRQTYGITTADYDRMLAAQGGVCAICGRPPKKRRLAVDHDHKTGQVRGLLCFKCNYMRLGHTNTVELARAIIRYLEQYSCSTTGQAVTASKTSLSD